MNGSQLKNYFLLPIKSRSLTALPLKYEKGLTEYLHYPPEDDRIKIASEQKFKFLWIINKI